MSRLVHKPTSSQGEAVAALATAVGGAVAIVRVSGEGAVQVVEGVWRGRRSLAELPPRSLHLGRLSDGDEPVDAEVLAVHFRAAGSFTGEEMVELHCHGGALVARLVLQAVLRAGARPAEAGEFTKRAFLNGRLDLTRAEAINDLVRAQSMAAVRVANTQLRGGLAHPVESAWDTCRHVLAELEVTLDFPDEDATPLADSAELRGQLDGVVETLKTLAASSLEGEILREGVSLVIAGPPNAGKSTLLNAILGRDRAIVSDIPGTTRDTLEELAHIRDIPVRLTDTAGIREAANAIEEQGVQRSHSALQTAQIVLWVTEDAGKEPMRRDAERLAKRASVIEVVNKIDQSADQRPMRDLPEHGRSRVRISALERQGIELVFDAVEEAVWSTPHHTVPDVAVSARHAHELDRALQELHQVIDGLNQSADEAAAASALRGAMMHLGKILGREVTSEDILGDIFSRFCMGK